MAFKKTGQMYEPREISIMVCDVCGREIGMPDGYKTHPHFELVFDREDPHMNNPDWDICSKECLIKLANSNKSPGDGESR